jgi:hypothetical protein
MGAPSWPASGKSAYEKGTMIERLRQCWRWFIRRAAFWLRSCRMTPVAGRPGVEPQSGRQTISRPFNAAAQAFQQLFAPKQSSEQEVHFRHVESGRIIERAEEWIREEDGSFRTTTTRTLAVTCSGEVVMPDKLRALCSQCGGYESFLCCCAKCGRTLCRLHVRYFVEGRNRVPLCERHYQETLNSFNAWQAMDRIRKERPRL